MIYRIISYGVAIILLFSLNFTLLAEATPEPDVSSPAVESELSMLREILLSQEKTEELKTQLKTDEGTQQLNKQLPHINISSLRYLISTEKGVKWLKWGFGSESALKDIKRRLVLGHSALDAELNKLKQALISPNELKTLQEQLKTAEGLLQVKDRFPHIDSNFLSETLSSAQGISGLKEKLSSAAGVQDFKRLLLERQRAFKAEIAQLQTMLASQAGVEDLSKKLNTELGMKELRRELPNVDIMALKQALFSKTGVAELKARLSSANQVSELKSQLMTEYVDLKAQLIAEAGLVELKKKVLSELSEIKKNARAEADKMKQAAMGEVEELKKQALSEVDELKKTALAEANQLKDKAVEKVMSSLSLVEEDLRGIGIFPNSQGYLDARLHYRARYLDYFSSGIFFDYTTFRTEQGTDASDKSEKQTREYRLDLDVFKGIIPLHDLLSIRRSQLSFEPGVNLKGILQNIKGTAVYTNSFDERIFRGEESTYQRFIISAKAELSCAFGETLKLDLSGEYVPFIYSVEDAKVITSQFQDVSPQKIFSITNGAQFTGMLKYRSGGFGDYSLQGKVFIDRGVRSASSFVIDGNYSYESVDRAQSNQRDIWLEIIHGMKYLSAQLGFTPSLILGLQHRTISLDNSYQQKITYRLGLIVEFD